MTRELLTFEEARRFLRLHRGTLYKLIRKGDLPAFRVGKQWRIDKDELIDWLRKQQVNNNKEKKEVMANV